MYTSRTCLCRPQSRRRHHEPPNGGGLTGSAGASLNEPPELQQLALNFLATFFSRHLTEQQPSYICTGPENFPTRNMRPLSIREPPDRGWGTGVFPPALLRGVKASSRGGRAPYGSKRPYIVGAKEGSSKSR